MLDVFLHQLPTSLPTDSMHFFRRFRIAEVHNALAGLLNTWGKRSGANASALWRRVAGLGDVDDADDLEREPTVGHGDSLGPRRG